jgi:serine protease inhibitor
MTPPTLKAWWLLSLTLLLPVPSTAAPSTTVAIPSPIVSLGDAHSAFGLRLLPLLADGVTNTFVSPLSIAIALAMCSRGADPVGRAEIFAALGLQAMGTEAAVDAAYEQLLTSLPKSDPSVLLTLADSVWSRGGLNPSYVTALRTTYEAQALPLTTAAAVNQWISNATQGMIPLVLDELDTSLRALLINAVLLEGKWQSPFELSLTSDQPFHAPSGDFQIPLMQQTSTLPFASHEMYDMVQLELGEGAFSAFVVLPLPPFNTTDVLATLGPSSFENLTSRYVQLYLPRYNISQSLDVQPALRRLGVEAIFSPGHLLRMSPDRRLYVSSIVHATALQVNETGLRAAAVTMVGLTAMLFPVPRIPIVMRVDRPFLLAIRHEEAGLVFLGEIVEP